MSSARTLLVLPLLCLVLTGLVFLSCGFLGGEDESEETTPPDEVEDPAAEAVPEEMKNPDAFSSSSGLVPTSALPAAALPASALPAAALPAALVIEGDSGGTDAVAAEALPAAALPAAALPTSFSSNAALPDIPPSAAFGADVSGFNSFYLLDTLADFDLPDLGGLRDTLDDPDDLTGRLGDLVGPFEQAKAVIKTVDTVLLSLVFFPRKMFELLDKGVTGKTIKATYLYNSAVVWFNQPERPLSFKDDFDEQGRNVTLPTVRLIAQACKDMELPSFSAPGDNLEAFSPEVELDQADGKGLLWSLLVSGAGPRLDLEDFVLVNGITSADGRQGIWRLFDFTVPDRREPLMTISYLHGDGSHLMTKLVLERGKSKGSYLVHRRSADLSLFLFHNARDDKNYLVFLDRSADTRGGFLKKGGSAVQCWKAGGTEDKDCALFKSEDARNARRAILDGDPLFVRDGSTDRSEAEF
ncbi:MAG: hypothetical protein A2284_00800 [Deltaproteobacteria bacterium RIFOXYA12_FULL_61_11]|nr:MAG: hypothetical protein A2284_00800 [Deltaproteobacteria bacterium RIFOXYA12_FULL_61_11]